MSNSDKIKTINNKIERNKAQYSLDRQTAKISALSLGNVSKYKFVTDKYVLPRKYLLEKSAAFKKFEYFSLGKELKAQNSAAEKQYQKLDKVFESNKKEVKILKSRTKSNLVYSKDLLFTNTTTLMNFLNVLFIQNKMIYRILKTY